MNKRSIAMAAWLLLLVALSSGCGVELVGGAERGNVETTMSDDPSSDAPSQYRAPAESLGTTPGSGRQLVDLAGQVSADVRVALVDGNGNAVPVTAGVATGEVTIASTQHAPLGDQEVLVGVYPTVRLTFTRVEAELDAGSAMASVEVDIGGTPLVVDVPVQVTVRANEVTRVEVDMNTVLWLPLADPGSGLVGRSAFASAVAVRVGG